MATANSPGALRNRREKIGSQRDISPEKDNNLVRKRNNKADSPIIPDAFKCETYWLTRIVFLRSLAFVYFVAFLVALNQNKQLIGSNGLLPAPNFFKMVKNHFGAQFPLASFQAVPTLLWAVNPENIDFYIDLVAYAGILISLFILYFGCANMCMMLTLWILYHSLVNIGQRWYSFGWESQLLETGFLAIFLCPVIKLQQIPVDSLTPVVVKLGYRWLLFRIMFGAGMIKIRGDQCWRDLTCMNYHYQTQPVPNPLSYYFHQSPEIFHKFETLSNHFIELIAPWFLLIPGRPTMLCGVIQIVFQVVLILSGNLSFLNWLTILPSIMCFNDHHLSSLFSTTSPARQEVNRLNKLIHEGKSTKASKGLHIRWIVEFFLGLLLVFLSIPVVQNLFSSRQVMNTSFETLRIVNTYGAFGSVTKERTEIILQGTRNSTVHGSHVVWRDYEFKCKPGDVMRRPCFISPYHYRLDWLMWFAAFQRIQDNPWLVHLTAKLLNNDPGATSLIAINPFRNGDPPRYIRAEHYLYEFTKIGDSKEGQRKWWSRRYIRPYFPPISLKDLRQYMQSQGWKIPDYKK